jgi:hypothetical protein
MISNNLEYRSAPGSIHSVFRCLNYTSIVLRSTINLNALFSLFIILHNIVYPTISVSTEQACAAATLWDCIREVLGSSLSRDTGYYDRGISWFYSAPSDISNALQFISHTTKWLFIIYCHKINGQNHNCVRIYLQQVMTLLIRSRKPRLTTVGIRCADHATPSIRKGWHYFAIKRRSLGRHSSLADQSHGV